MKTTTAQTPDEANAAFKGDQWARLPQAYISRTASGFTVIYQGMPLMANGSESAALAIAGKNKIQTALRWNGEKALWFAA